MDSPISTICRFPDYILKLQSWLAIPQVVRIKTRGICFTFKLCFLSNENGSVYFLVLMLFLLLAEDLAVRRTLNFGKNIQLSL